MPEHTLVLRFLAELLRKTIDIHNDNDFQAVVQSFANELLPWVRPADLAWPPRPQFTLFESVDMTSEDIHSVTLSPEGLGLFRAWLRRQGLDPFMSSS